MNNGQPEPDVTCCWCGRTVTREQAIDEGWTPDWWEGEVYHDSPACPSCAAEHLEMSADGEMVLRPGQQPPKKGA